MRPSSIVTAATSPASTWARNLEKGTSAASSGSAEAWSPGAGSSAGSRPTEPCSCRTVASRRPHARSRVHPDPISQSGRRLASAPGRQMTTEAKALRVARELEPARQLDRAIRLRGAPEAHDPVDVRTRHVAPGPESVQRESCEASREGIRSRIGFPSLASMQSCPASFMRSAATPPARRTHRPIRTPCAALRPDLRSP